MDSSTWNESNLNWPSWKQRSWEIVSLICLWSYLFIASFLSEFGAFNICLIILIPHLKNHIELYDPSFFKKWSVLRLAVWTDRNGVIRLDYNIGLASILKCSSSRNGFWQCIIQSEVPYVKGTTGRISVSIFCFDYQNFSSEEDHIWGSFSFQKSYNSGFSLLKYLTFGFQQVGLGGAR